MEITLNEMMKYLIYTIADRHSITLKKAKELLKEALTRNIVIAEIVSMTDYIVEEES